MKVKQEKYGKLILLEGMWEVGSILERAPGHPWKWDDFKEIVSRNKNIAQRYEYMDAEQNEKWQKHMMEELNECFEQIEKGHPEENVKIAELSEVLKDMALEIEPSLKLQDLWAQTENGPMFDAGAVAEDSPNPCFQKVTSEDVSFRDGAGDGAYRIIINTDCCYFQDPTRQGAAVAALALIVQQRAPLEIWIQQGWLGGGAGSNDGITLFPIHSGGMVSPQNLWFWIASPHKDSPFSYTINRILGRKKSNVSKEAELPNDLYLYNVCMPEVTIENNEELAKWVAMTAKKMLFEEQAPQNLGEKTDLNDWLNKQNYNDEE